MCDHAQRAALIGIELFITIDAYNVVCSSNILAHTLLINSTQCKMPGILYVTHFLCILVHLIPSNSFSILFLAQLSLGASFTYENLATHYLASLLSFPYFLSLPLYFPFYASLMPQITPSNKSFREVYPVEERLHSIDTSVENDVLKYLSFFVTF